jgi:hypothetical protein
MRVVDMLVLGVILFLLGFFLGIGFLEFVGAILAVIGLILWVAPIGGRRIY